jgi:hypothetical protein
MNSLKLNNAHSLTIEPEGKRVRVVVYNNGLEEVCRKEYLSKLIRFIGSDQEQVFKGRLRLFKTAKGIVVEVKNEIAGYISTNDFLNFLKNATVPISSQF